MIEKNDFKNIAVLRLGVASPFTSTKCEEYGESCTM